MDDGAINYSNQPRVLIVDNDEEARNSLRDVLHQAGFNVQLVSGQGDDLVQNSIEAGHRFRPHVAIIDLRINGSALFDGFRQDDRGGLQLIPYLKNASCILRSGYLSPSVLREANMEKDILSVIGCDESPKVLIDLIKIGASQKSAAFRQLEVSWQLKALAQLHSFMAHETTNFVQGFAEDILSQLFPTYRNLRVESITDKVNLANVSRHHSLVLLVYPEDNLHPIVVKFSLTSRTLAEQKSYNQFIKNRIGRFYSEHKESVLFWDLGATSYIFMGTHSQYLPTYTAYFFDSNTSESKLANPIEHFFSNIWGSYYEKARLISEPTLFEHYNKILNLDKRIDQLISLPQDSIPTQRIPLPNPAEWLQKNKQYSVISNARETITHGDLHGDNMFVDISSNAWAIDFERTGWGHILRDFAELEVDLITRLTTLPDHSFETFHQYISNLLPKSTLDMPQVQIEYPNTSLKRSSIVIKKLRSLAQRLTETSNSEEYLWALLFDAIFVAAISPQQRYKALILSSLICLQLEELSVI